MENYYETLGVAENATQDQIKSAFRKLAMEHHPDRNRDDPAAEEKFKKINEAYATLQDPQSRSQYDNMRKFGGNLGGNPFQQNGFDFHFNFGGDINDIINQFFSGGFGPRQARNRDFSFNLHISLEDAFAGKQMPVQFAVNGQNYNLNVNIPAGIDNGARIRYQGHGDKSVPNAPPGDLYIQIQILEHSIFKRRGPNLQTEIKIDALEAVIGCERDIKCVDGQILRVQIPAGTQPESVIRLKERGMPIRPNGPERGDCMVIVKITVPNNLSDLDKNIIKEILHRRSA